MPITLVSLLHGSHLFGTDTPQSDRDVKEVVVPSASSILLAKPDKIAHDLAALDPAQAGLPHAARTDREVTPLRRFMSQVLEGQPNALDMLFAPASMWLAEPHAAWISILANRERLVGAKLSGFVGHVYGQAKERLDSAPRIAALEAARHLFQQAIFRHNKRWLGDLGDEIAALQAAHGRHMRLQDIVVNKTTGQRIPHLVIAGRKLALTITPATALATLEAALKTYGRRTLEAVHSGADWKALSTALRVANEAIELLESGHITLPRPEARHLVDVKTGRLAMEDVVAEIEAALQRIEALKATTTLPPEGDRGVAETLVIDIHRRQVNAAL